MRVARRMIHTGKGAHDGCDGLRQHPERGSQDARAIILACLLVLVGAESHAAISKPDAVLYGSARLGGVPATGSVVSVRKAGVALEQYTVGSAGPADFYAIRIPVAQQADGEARQATEVYEGDTVQLFVDEMMVAEVPAQGGIFRLENLTMGALLCAGGSKSGMECVLDGDCPGGVCVVARGVCDGGADNGMSCECIGETTCCAGGAMCTATARLCLSGSNQGAPCVNDGQCPGSTCGTTDTICMGGTRDGAACTRSADCGGSPCGRRPTPTPTVTRTATATPTRTGNQIITATPTATATPTPPTGGECAGDCNSDNMVQVNELVTGVNIALDRAQVSSCPSFDRDGDNRVAVNELVTAVNNALRDGCAAR